MKYSYECLSHDKLSLLCWNSLLNRFTGAYKKKRANEQANEKNPTKNRFWNQLSVPRVQNGRQNVPYLRDSCITIIIMAMMLALLVDFFLTPFHLICPMYTVTSKIFKHITQNQLIRQQNPCTRRSWNAEKIALNGTGCVYAYVISRGKRYVPLLLFFFLFFW